MCHLERVTMLPLLTEEEVYALLARFAHRIRFALRVASYTASMALNSNCEPWRRSSGEWRSHLRQRFPRPITSHNDGDN